MTAGLKTERVSVGTPARKIRFGHWSAGSDARAVVLLFNGLTEFLEKYQELADDLTSRGFDVVSLDWGGQGLSDRLLCNPQKVHTRDYQDRLEEASALVFWAKEILDQKPVILLGHSMGGHIALRVAGESPPPRLVALALSAPMTAFPPIPVLDRLFLLLASVGCALGLEERYAPGRGDYDDRIAVARAFLMSSDTRRVKFQEALWPGDPALRLGGVTWGWVRASLKSCASLRRTGYLEAIACPTLIAIAGRDVLVSNWATRRCSRRIPNSSLVRYANSLHEILMERDEIRDRFLADFDVLVSKAIG